MPVRFHTTHFLRLPCLALIASVLVSALIQNGRSQSSFAPIWADDAVTRYRVINLRPRYIASVVCRGPKMGAELENEVTVTDPKLIARLLTALQNATRPPGPYGTEPGTVRANVLEFRLKPPFAGRQDDRGFGFDPQLVQWCYGPLFQQAIAQVGDGEAKRLAAKVRRIRPRIKQVSIVGVNRFTITNLPEVRYWGQILSHLDGREMAYTNDHTVKAFIELDTGNPKEKVFLSLLVSPPAKRYTKPVTTQEVLWHVAIK